MTRTYQRPVDSLALHIGQVTIAANDIQFALLYIFQDLLNNRALARSLYFSAPSDAAQQKMVLEAIDSVLRPIDAAVAERMSKRIRGLDKLRVRRNDVVHAIWTTDPQSMKIMPLQPKSSLKGKDDLKASMKQLTADLMIEASQILMMRWRLFELPHFKNQALANTLMHGHDVFT